VQKHPNQIQKTKLQTAPESSSVRKS